MPLNLKSVANGSVILNPASTVTDKTITIPATDGTMVVQDSSNITSVANLNFTGTGNRITGDFSNATFANRVMFQTSTVNGNTLVNALPNGTSTTAGIWAFNNSDLTNAGRFRMTALATEMSLIADYNGSGTYLPMTFYTGGSERVRVDTAGNVGIGTSSPVAKLDVNSSIFARPTTTAQASSIKAVASDYLSLPSFTNTGVAQYGSTATGTTAGLSNASLGILEFINGSAALINTNGSAPIVFAITSQERMRITSSGNLLISTAGSYIQLKSASTTFDISAQAGGNDFLRINANGTQRYQFNDAGQAYNTTGTWGTISDVRLKENIVDATSKLEGINQLRVVNFNLKTDPDVKQIGFIAQEVEQIFPGLVSDGEEDGEGGYYKSVKTTVLIPMLVKAIQEQQALIQDLTTRLTALEGN